MKIAEFDRLCQREWDREPRGCVSALRLTAESLLDLTQDALNAGQIAYGTEGAVVVGARVGSAVNHVAGGVWVPITPGEADEADVARGPDREMRTVSL